MSSIIRLKENETTGEMFEFLQNTVYMGLGKTEILRTILAEKTWEIKSQVRDNNVLDPVTKAKIKKAYQSHKSGKSARVKNEDIETFLETL